MSTCTLTGTADLGPHWSALDCAEHGVAVAYVDRHAPDPEVAAAASFANHVHIVERAAAERARSAARVASPYAATCTYDTGAMFDCAPACNDPARVRITYSVSGGTFVADVCRRHTGATLGRIHPARDITETEIPR